MKSSDPIFGTPFIPQEDARPDPSAIQTFLESMFRERGKEAHARSLADFRLLIQDAASFRDRGGRSDPGACVRYGVLGLARIARDELRDAVELFVYHLQGFSSIDLQHPAEFIRTSEGTISRLNPKKLNDVVRMARLQEMVDARKALIARLERQRTVLEVELQRIAWYVWENLAGIGRSMEAVRALFSDPAVGAEKERIMIDEIRIYVKDRVKSELSGGRLTQEGLARAKQEFDDLSAVLRAHIRDDASSLKRSCETIRDLVQKVGNEIGALLAERDRRSGSESIQQAAAFFARIEQSLFSLLAGCRFDPGVRETPADARYRDIITIKRSEMIEHLLSLLRDDRTHG